MRLKRFLLILIFTFMILGIIGFYLNTSYLDRLEVRGNSHYTRAEVLEFVGFNDTSTLLHVMMNRVNIIENKGYIDVIEIEYPNLKNVIIHVTEKEIIGYAEYMGEYLCIDTNGYIIDVSKTPDISKPKITGLDIESFTLEEPFDAPSEVITAIGTLYRISKTFNININYIDFKNSGGDEIVLVTDQVEVYIGGISKIEKKFQMLKEILDMLPEHEEGILHLEDVEGNIIFQSTLPQPEVESEVDVDVNEDVDETDNE